MTELTPVTREECARRLLSLSRPVVVTHVRPDGDTVGSAAALTLALRALGKEATLLSPDKIPERLAFLLSGVPLCESAEGCELVAIDVASPTQLGGLAPLEYTLTIDHHARSTPFSDFYAIPDASSAGEVLYGVLLELEKISDFRIDEKIAYPLYAAISSDTGGFIYSSAGADTLRAAARLIEYGIDFADINHRLFNSKSEEQIRAEGFVASRLKTALGGALSYATLSKGEREELNLLPEHFETAIDVVRALAGAKIAVFVRESDDGTIRASLRSTGFNVADIAAELGGGGHIRAAGCSPVAKSAEAAAKIIIEKIAARYAAE